MSPLIRLNEFIVVSQWSKKLAHDQLWSLVQEMDSIECPKLTLKVLNDVEFYADHYGVKISGMLQELIEELKDECEENL